jgi:hypothetical protein
MKITGKFNYKELENFIVLELEGTIYGRYIVESLCGQDSKVIHVNMSDNKVTKLIDTLKESFFVKTKKVGDEINITISNGDVKYSNFKSLTINISYYQAPILFNVDTLALSSHPEYENSITITTSVGYESVNIIDVIRDIHNKCFNFAPENSMFNKPTDIDVDVEKKKLSKLGFTFL